MNKNDCDFIKTSSSIPLLTTDDHESPAPPEWVMLIPEGKFLGRDGRGPYQLDADAVLAAYNKAAIELPIDYDHQSLEADAKAGPVPAAGWIKALEIRDGALWGRVRWTARAAELIQAREYRYISPVFRVRSGRIIEINGAGLTHYPNLKLLPIAMAMKGAYMNEEIMQKLQALLKLPATATIEDVLAELQRLMERLQAAEAAAQSRQPDPAEWAPMAQYKTVADELAKLQTEVAAQKAEAAVTAAMSSGKLAPALKDWAIGYASRDPQGFADWVAKAPVLVDVAAQGQGRKNVAPNADTLTEEDRIACALLGMSEADFAAHKKSFIKE